MIYVYVCLLFMFLYVNLHRFFYFECHNLNYKLYFADYIKIMSANFVEKKKIDWIQVKESD